MIMEISESKQTLKLLNSSSREIYDDHYLYLIRIWAVGKETNRLVLFLETTVSVYFI